MKRCLVQHFLHFFTDIFTRTLALNLDTFNSIKHQEFEQLNNHQNK